MRPLRAFFISFAGGLLALIAGQAVLSAMLAAPVEAPYEGELNIPQA